MRPLNYNSDLELDFRDTLFSDEPTINYNKFIGFLPEFGEK